ncbi:MAG: spiroplasma phage ORF1-like family protein [Spiroplasma sp.]
MKKFFNYWLIFIVLVFGVFQAPNFSVALLQTQISTQASGITEEDFFNTMFLKSEFFENWSDTNYFINPTLKTSKPLNYKKDWYIDYLKDTYSSGVSFQKPSPEFLDMISNSIKYLDKEFSYELFQIDRNTNPEYYGDWLKWNINWSDTVTKQYLKYIYERFLIMIGAGMKLYQENKQGSIIVWQGWADENLKKIAQKWDDRLSSFNYFPYQKFSSFTANSWNYDTLALELQGQRFIDFDENKYIAQARLFAKANKVRNELYVFLNKYSDIVIDELIRVQNGGSPDYDNIPDGTEKILFSFENVSSKDVLILNTYRMTLTIDNQNKIRAGTLSFLNKKDQGFQDGLLNFILSFVLGSNNKYGTEIETFSYEKGSKVTYSKLQGFLNLDEFLKQFFSNALIPIFENRSTFIEAGYIDNLAYNVVMLNFFGLKNLDFVNLLTDKNNKPVAEFNTLIANVLTISKDFYKDYIRSLFDSNPDTYVQGYNREYGLIANNGFKIYPQYFYYSDRYKTLNFQLYSSYNNRFYNTKYGQTFNFDYSVSKNFSIEYSDKYVFEGDDVKIEKYPFKYQKIESRNIGYNVFTLISQKEGELYRYFDFNFGIYNWQEITKDGLFPTGQWWQAKYESCAWYNIACYIKNAVIWIVNNIPGVKEGNQLASGIAKIFETVYKFFDQIFAVWKFSPALYNTVTNLFLLIIFMKLVRLV